MLTAQKLNKHFEGVYAVRDVSFKLEAGKITGIIGPNGSGKTTVVNLLSGMIDWDEGVVILNGEELRQMKLGEVYYHHLTRTFQNLQLLEQSSVWDNLVLALQQRPIFKTFFFRLSASCKKQAEILLKKVDLWEKRNELTMNLSYGERKLLEIARVLALDAKVIFFDEPFAGLSSKTAEKVSAILKELRTRNKTVVLIEHNMTIIRDLSDYVLFMDDGELIAQGSSEEVFNLTVVLGAYLGKNYERP